MKVKNSSHFVAYILVISIIFNLWLNLLNNRLTNKVEKYSIKVELLKEKNEQLKANYLKSVFCCDYTISSDLELYNTNGHLCSFDSIFLFKSRLFFRYTKLSCNLCVGHQIQLLKTYIDTIGEKNVVILAGMDQIRYVSAFKRVNNLKCEVILLKRFILDTEVVSSNAPYYFTISNNRRVDNFFMPDRDMPDLTIKYFHLVKDHISK